MSNAPSNEPNEPEERDGLSPLLEEAPALQQYVTVDRNVVVDECYMAMNGKREITFHRDNYPNFGPELTAEEETDNMRNVRKMISETPSQQRFIQSSQKE